ncbi:MAG: acetolactate synthase small subunit [Fimbriimonas sp.]|nr:acetolactate synthase small subunit [Fimbriimonas sp.]
MSTHQHTITALVQNEAGTINRLVSLFRRRGFSLASFNAGDCEDPGYSRLTFIVNGDDAVVSQCLKQLNKLIDVIECEDLEPEHSVQRELALIRVEPTSEQRAAVHGIVSEFMARTPRTTATTIVVEQVSDVASLERLIAALMPYNVTEIVRTGTVAIKV